MLCPQPVCHIYHVFASYKKGKVVYKGGFRDRIPGVPLNFQGGAGFYISRPAAELVLQSYAECVSTCTMDYGDNRLSCCLRLLNVSFRSSENMWTRTPWMALHEDRRQLVSSFPTSFHMFRNSKTRFASLVHNWTTHTSPLDVTEACKSDPAWDADRPKVSLVSMCAVSAAQRKFFRVDEKHHGVIVPSVPLSWDALEQVAKQAGAEQANPYK